MQVSMNERSLRGLLDIQQSDGGWAYSTNSSWTEPTCYAILALRWAGASAPAISRASEWLARRQRRDGGWSPGSSVEQSTHVTSLSILALSGLEGYEDIADRGVAWILSQSGAESSFLSRMASVVTGVASASIAHNGWPWIPGAAAWVIPTSLAILALQKHKHSRYAGYIASRVKEARSFLLSRRCPDHGWNHGGLFRACDNPRSYPETTGIALLALAGTTSPEIAPSIRCGEQLAREAQSSEGEYWLRLGLSAHGRNAAPTGRYRDWTVNQMALGVIADTGKAGSNPFIDNA
jgi:hypothetical protein